MTENNPAPANKKSQKQLYAILLVTFIPLIAAYVAYYTGWGVPDGTVNKGQLLDPAQDIKPLITETGASDALFNGNHLWRIVIPVDMPCDDACQQNLYVTRQVHIRLGDKSERIERIALNVGAEQGEDYLAGIAAEHPRLKTYTLAHNDWRLWLRSAALEQLAEQNHFYLLVDPQGFAMLLYTQDNTGNELLKDIKRILRYSPDE